MKRIDATWWKGADGYYRQEPTDRPPYVFEGPFDTMDNRDPINLYNAPKVVDSGFVQLEPVEPQDDSAE